MDAGAWAMMWWFPPHTLGEGDEDHIGVTMTNSPGEGGPTGALCSRLMGITLGSTTTASQK